MTMMREDVCFQSGGETCAAWLYPAGSDEGPRPIVVMAHGVTGTRRDGLWSFADRFAAAGINVLLFDHRGFGDSGGEKDLFDPLMQLNDWRAALAFARSLPNVDATKVATLGSSLGGGNALWAAADDGKVAACISQVPFVTMGQAPHSPEILEQMLAVAAKGGYLPAVGQLGEPAMINQPGGEVGWRRVVALGDQSRWRNRMSAAWLVNGYEPGQYAATLHCPWLVCIAADEIEFLHRHLLGRTLLGAPKASTVQTRAYLTAKTTA